MARTMIKFLPLDFLSVSHRIPWKKLNAVYRLQIPAQFTTRVQEPMTRVMGSWRVLKIPNGRHKRVV